MVAILLYFFTLIAATKTTRLLSACFRCRASGTRENAARLWLVNEHHILESELNQRKINFLLQVPEQRWMSVRRTKLGQNEIQGAVGSQILKAQSCRHCNSPWIEFLSTTKHALTVCREHSVRFDVLIGDGDNALVFTSD